MSCLDTTKKAASDLQVIFSGAGDFHGSLSSVLRFSGTGMNNFPDRYFPGRGFLAFMACFGVPAATFHREFARADRYRPRIPICHNNKQITSCSTTINVLPRSRMFFIRFDDQLLSWVQPDGWLIQNIEYTGQVGDLTRNSPAWILLRFHRKACPPSGSASSSQADVLQESQP